MPDYLPGSSSTCYQVCTLLGPTALPHNAGTLYPDTSPPTDNSLATNHRPFPGMENRFSTYYGLPSCLFHCLLPRLHFCVANKYCNTCTYVQRKSIIIILSPCKSYICICICSVYSSTPRFGGIVIARGDELLRPDGPSIQAQRAEARRAKGGGEVVVRRLDELSR